MACKCETKASHIKEEDGKENKIVYKVWYDSNLCYQTTSGTLFWYSDTHIICCWVLTPTKTW